MKYQKSPFPYVFLLVGILSISVYSNLVTDKQINAPIVHTIKANALPEKTIVKVKEVRNKELELVAVK
ncbi:hypothetical protein [Tenacibaculum sp. 190524A05c]|uniref:Uncharacterized protein n=1 Tax=Tenacibaculum platacis TaxID=3137852 RepID=A0ABM9NRG1_9FLAO